MTLALFALLLASPVLADLDAMGRQMLDPLREQALHSDEWIPKLHLAPDAHVADVGAGPGFLTLPLARAVPRGWVLATDIRADYLARAAERAALAGLRNVKTRVVSPAHPQLDARSLDLVVLCQVDHYLADRASYFAELVSSLRAGGRIVIINFEKYREDDLLSARRAGLRVDEEWRLAPPFFAVILRPEP